MICEVRPKGSGRRLGSAALEGERAVWPRAIDGATYACYKTVRIGEASLPEFYFTFKLQGVELLFTWREESYRKDESATWHALPNFALRVLDVIGPVPTTMTFAVDLRSGAVLADNGKVLYLCQAAEDTDAFMLSATSQV